MKTLNVLLVSTVMMIGLAVSSSASAKIAGQDAHEILGEGEILMKSKTEAERHVFTVIYDGMIYWCFTDYHHIECNKLKDTTYDYNK